MNRYKGKSVIITGAGNGIGKGAAMAFASEGAKLVLSDLNATTLEAVASELRKTGSEVVTLVADVADDATAPALVAACLKAYGRLDVAINNAGVAHPIAKLPKIDNAQARLMLSVNLMGVFMAMKAQIPVMEAQGAGVIANVASVAGVSGAPLMAAYAASKHGVIGLTKSAAAESAKRGVRINAICPASTETNMVTDLVKAQGGDMSEAVQRIAMATPMARLATVDEIVQGILWICSDENSFMTGHALVLDGGLTTM